MWINVITMHGEAYNTTIMDRDSIILNIASCFLKSSECDQHSGHFFQSAEKRARPNERHQCFVSHSGSGIICDKLRQDSLQSKRKQSHFQRKLW